MRSRKTAKIDSRVTPEEKKRVLEMIEKYSLRSISDVIHHAVFERPLKVEEKIFSTAQIERIKETNKQISRVGANINQIARVANQQKEISKEEIQRILILQKEIAEHVESLVKMMR